MIVVCKVDIYLRESFKKTNAKRKRREGTEEEKINKIAIHPALSSFPCGLISKI